MSLLRGNVNGGQEDDEKVGGRRREDRGWRTEEGERETVRKREMGLAGDMWLMNGSMVQDLFCACTVLYGLYGLYGVSCAYVRACVRGA
jgi:hypothetical protein